MIPIRHLCAALAVALGAIGAPAQAATCPPPGSSVARLEALKRDAFKMPDTAERQRLALALTACLGDPNPAVRDGIAFEALSSWMRGGSLDEPTLRQVRDRLIEAMAAPDPDGFLSSFSALVLSEVARTDRVRSWMSADERDAVVRAGAAFLTRVTDYRAFDDRSGFRHAVAHAADLAMQLALNPQTTKTQLDQLMLAVAAQVAPDAAAYWAGESERLARPIVFIAQRKLHSDAEWQAFFARVTSPAPLDSWQSAFGSERGIKKRHNVRAFLLSVYASATIGEDEGLRRLIGPVTAALKAVP